MQWCAHTRLYRHRDRKAKEVDDPCFECYQYLAVCPKGAISTRKFPDFEDTPIGQCPMSYDDMISSLEQRRSIRWFTKKKASREEFEKFFEADITAPPPCTPRAWNSPWSIIDLMVSYR